MTRSHVRNAISRFDQTDFEDTGAKHAAARKIMSAARRHDIEVDDSLGRRQGRQALISPRQRQCQPLSTMRSTPLTDAFSSRNTVAPTMSAIVASRPVGVWAV